MLYITTALDYVEHDSTSPQILVGEATYHAMTPSVWAWVVQSVRKAVVARDRGEINPDRIEEILARGRELKNRLPEFDQGELRRAMAQPQRPPGRGDARETSSPDGSRDWAARSAALARLPTPWEEGGGEVTPGDVWLVRVSGPGEPPEYAATTGGHLEWLAKSNDAARAIAEKSGKAEKAKARRTA